MDLNGFGVMGRSECLPQGDAEGQSGQKDEVEQQQGRSEEPVDVAGVVDVAQIAVGVVRQS